MGKNLIQQARGKGSPTYRAPSFRWKQAKHKSISAQAIRGKIIDIVTSQGHSAPLYHVSWDDGEKTFSVCPEGIRVGDQVTMGNKTMGGAGHVSHLADLPEGTLIFNIEQNPGDGGKYVRSSGTFAKIVSKDHDRVTVMMPSKKKKVLLGTCRATIGVVAGGGRTEKPFLKAGHRYHAMRAKNKLYPHISGTSQNAVDHPFGGSSSGHKGKPTISPRNAPPGRKVGKLSPRRTGKKR